MFAQVFALFLLSFAGGTVDLYKLSRLISSRGLDGLQKFGQTMHGFGLQNLQNAGQQLQAQSSMFARESFTQQLHYPNGVIQEQFALFPQLIGQKNQEKINWLYSKEDLSLTLLEKRDIHLDINTFLKVIGYNLKVEELYLNGGAFVGWIDWTQFPENLRVLELTDSNLLFFMGSFGALPRNLEKLSLKGCKNLHFCDWSALPPKLKSLDISGVNVNNPVVYAEELPKSLTQLKITMDPLQHFEQKQALVSGKWTACEDGDDIVFKKNWIWKEEPAVEKTTVAPEFANVA